MKLEFTRTFQKDVAAVQDPKRLRRLRELLRLLEESSHLAQVPNVASLKGHPGFFRIRLGDFRVGFKLEGDALVFCRFLHRKDIYRAFP